jgi:hypothetical protein
MLLSQFININQRINTRISIFLEENNQINAIYPAQYVGVNTYETKFMNIINPDDTAFCKIGMLFKSTL